ncbi:AbaSI family restriction endonuclease [Mucilaginibacter sp.]
MTNLLDSRILKNNHIIVQLAKICDLVHQSAIIGSLLMDEENWWCYPVTESHVKCNGKNYRIDLYFPDIKFAVEIDELHHNGKQAEKNDPLREDAITKHLTCEFLRIKIAEGFIHADAVKLIKAKMFEIRKKYPALNEWNPQHFDISKALEDDPTIIFVKGTETQFPPFRLAKEFHDRQDLKIVIMRDSFTGFADPLLKQVDEIIKIEYISPSGKNGFVNWSGTTINHPVITSGQTSVSLQGSSVHNLKKDN